MSKYFTDFELNLNKMNYNKNDSEHILQLNFAYIISCMETYLSTAMWGTLKEYPKNYHNLAKCINNSAKISTIFNKGIPEFIQQELQNLQYHNLAQVKIYYKYSFDINFKSDLSYLLEAINKRHDIIHRCGTSKKNIKLTLAFEDLARLKKNIINFISDIDVQLDNNFKSLTL
jgi:hypothetical protein